MTEIVAAHLERVAKELVDAQRVELWESQQAYEDAKVALAAALAACAREANEKPHHPFCNHRHQEIGGPGCICVVTYRAYLAELKEAFDERAGAGTCSRGENVSDKTILMVKLVVAALVAFVAGYFFPRSHYEVRIERTVNKDVEYETRFCAVQWDGNRACSSPQGWLPLLPNERVRP